MGQDIGSFVDKIHGNMHVEMSDIIVVWNSNESHRALVLDPQEAVELQEILRWAMEAYYPDLEPTK